MKTFLSESASSPSFQSSLAAKSGRQLGITLAIPPAASSLRVAIVSDAIAGRNGVGTYYSDLVAHLTPLTGSIQLISPGEERDAELEWFSLPMPGDRTQRLAWPSVTALNRKLDQQQPNIIVLPSLGAFSYMALRYARRRNIPLVVVNHTNFDQLLSLYWPRWISRPLQYGLAGVGRWLMRQAAGVAAMNAESLREADSVGAAMVRVMGTPLSVEFLQPPIPRLENDLRRVIFVGRLAAEKRIDRLLDAARRLPHFEFTIGGDGPLRADVQRAASELKNLRYLGWVDRSQILREVDRADLLLLPSSVETFGTVALEALARRRYVLVSPQCGIASWPSIAAGLFTMQADESLPSAIARVAAMPTPTRDAIASRSWQAVRAFNDNTIHVWLKFLVDAAAR